MANDTMKKCLFCGKPENKVRNMFSAGNNHICDECVLFCYDILEEQGDNEGYCDPYYDLFLAMGKKRGCVMSGGRVDENRFAGLLLNDFREGRIGRITLESPDKPEGDM